MKKLRILFAVLAVFTASAGVFASELFLPVYYENTSAPGNCNVQVEANCPDATGTPCTASVSGNQIWKSTTGSDCIRAFKQQ